MILADQIALVLEGRLQQFGPPDAFFNRPVSQTVARFFGAKNFIAGTVFGGSFTSALGPILLANAHTKGPATLVVRPENIRLGIAPANTLHPTLISRTYLGTQTRLVLQTGGVQLEALANPLDAAGLEIGSPIPINLPPQSLWLLP